MKSNPRTMTLSLEDKIIGLVDASNIVLKKETRRVAFTIRIWFMRGSTQGFLYDLHDKQRLFKLVAKKNSKTILNCSIHTYRPIMGAKRNDIIGEEGVGIGDLVPMPILPMVFSFDGEKIFDGNIGKPF